MALDSVCWFVPASRNDSAVVIRLDAVGDFFIWMQSGAIDISRYARSSCRQVTLIANLAWADYARLTGLWDQVIAVDPKKLMKSPLYRLRCLATVRRLGAKLLIQPRAARVFLQEDAIARISGAWSRIGNSGTSVNINQISRKCGDRFYDLLISVDESRTQHELIRNDQFVTALTGKHATRFLPPRMPSTAAMQTVAIALGAGQIGRVWPVEKLAELVRYIKRKHPQLHITLLGVPEDQSLGRRLENLAGSDLDNRVGRTKLTEYVDAIASSTLVVCNDSSAYHIAMAFHKRVLCFLGGGHYGWFAPYPASYSLPQHEIVLNFKMDCYWCNWNCRYPPAASGAVRCVASISVEDAAASVEILLAACSNSSDTA